MRKNKWVKRRIQCGLIIALAAAMLTGCARSKILTRSVDPGQMIHVDQLPGMDENTNLNDTVLYVNPGDTIPLKISLDTDFIAFKQEQVDLVVKQKLYFRIKMPDNLSPEDLERLNRLNAGRFAEMSPAERSTILK